MRFYTQPAYQFRTPAFYGFDHHTCWSAVEIPVPLPWFMLACEPMMDESDFPLTYLVSSIDQLRPLFKSPKNRVRGLHMMIPGHRSNDSLWTCEQIRRGWDAQVEHHGATLEVTLLETIHGRLLPDPPIDSAKEIVRGDLLFSLSSGTAAGRQTAP